MEKRSGNAVAVGNFDGFHLGHRSIIKNTLKISEENSLGSVIVTFQPNPKLYFNTDNRLIFSDDKKKEVLGSSGIQRVEYVDFSNIFKMSGQNFTDKYLLEIFSMKHLVVGDNFRLGAGREWDLNRIMKYGAEKGFEVSVVPSEEFMGTKISSSVIRNYLRRGGLSTANKMLGMDYTVSGKVMRGNRIGTKLGFPTINIINDNCLLPNGVYQSKVKIDGVFYNSATYIGDNPTISGSKRKIETHIIDFSNDIYGSNVEIHFIKFKRDEKKFNSEKELISQINSDVNNIKFDFENEV